MTPIRNHAPARDVPLAPELPEFLKARVDHYYRERVEETWGGRHILHGRTPRSDDILLNGNDYLSLARDARILQATSEALFRDGMGPLMSGIFLHGASPQIELEARLARFMGSEAGVLCQSGFCANTGLVQSIANDQVPVYVDMQAHMSLWEGVRSAGAEAIMFRHNDAEHLARQVTRHGPGVILVDTIYSTNGSLCPLADFVSVSEANGCVLVVDESHSLGTHGPNGEGLAFALGLQARVHFRTASLAKAFAGRAGFIACPSKFADYFKFESLPAIFSTTLLPQEVAGLTKTLEIIRTEHWRREKLKTDSARLRTGLEALGYNLNGSKSQIISLEAGTEQQTMALRDALEARGIFGAVFCAPATPRNRALVRLSIHCSLTPTQMDRILTACAEIKTTTGFERWPSTRRLRMADEAAICEDGRA